MGQLNTLGEHASVRAPDKPVAAVLGECPCVCVCVCLYMEMPDCRGQGVLQGGTGTDSL